MSLGRELTKINHINTVLFQINFNGFHPFTHKCVAAASLYWQQFMLKCFARGLNNGLKWNDILNINISITGQHGLEMYRFSF